MSRVDADLCECQARLCDTGVVLTGDGILEIAFQPCAHLVGASFEKAGAVLDQQIGMSVTHRFADSVRQCATIETGGGGKRKPLDLGVARVRICRAAIRCWQTDPEDSVVATGE